MLRCECCMSLCNGRRLNCWGCRRRCVGIRHLKNCRKSIFWLIHMVRFTPLEVRYFEEPFDDQARILAPLRASPCLPCIIKVFTKNTENNKVHESNEMLPLSYWWCQHCCCVPVAAFQTDCQMAVRSIVGSTVHVWWLDSCAVLDCSVCPWIVGRVFWCHRSGRALTQPLLQRHSRLRRPQHCSSDFGVTSTNVDSYDCQCVSWHRARWQSVAYNLASDSRMADLPIKRFTQNH